MQTHIPNKCSKYVLTTKHLFIIIQIYQTIVRKKCSTISYFYEWGVQMMNTYYERAMRKNYRRKLEVKRNIILILSSVLLILAIVLFSFSICSEASTLSDHQVNYKYYKSIQIERGDTLWSIAKENMDQAFYANINDYISEIKQMNALSSNNIQSGNYLIIPYYSTELKSNHF